PLRPERAHLRDRVTGGVVVKRIRWRPPGIAGARQDLIPMLELTADNALDYHRSGGRIGQGPARAKLLGWGGSNVVLKVEIPGRTFVLKQSRPQLRTRDTWLSDIDRIYREQEVMQVLHSLLPEPTVPEVLFSDRANYVFAMSHAPAGSQVWKETLLA